MASKCIEHLNKLTKAINEVKTTVDVETYGVDLRDTLAAPLLLPPLKLELQVKELESGMPKYDDVIQAIGTLWLDFSKLALYEVYSI